MIRDIRLLLLALWLGAALFFSAVVAPVSFAVLRAFVLPNAGEIAGTIVNRVLTVVNFSGFIVSLALLLTAFLMKRSGRLFLLELLSLAVVAIATAVGGWLIAAKLHSLRVAMVLSVDQIPATDPRRIEFNQWHGYSVAALAIAMIAALIAFFAIANRSR